MAKPVTKIKDIGTHQVGRTCQPKSKNVCNYRCMIEMVESVRVWGSKMLKNDGLKNDVPSVTGRMSMDPYGLIG